MRRRVARILSGALLFCTVLAFVPPIRARATGVGVVAEAVGLGLPRPFAHDVARVEVTVAGVVGDAYLPAGRAPLVVLVPGAAMDARRDERLVRLARALGRAGRIVFIPELALARERLDERDIDRIVAVTAALDAHPRTEGRPVMFGISFGGSFSLVAAADPRIRDRLAQVAVFGAYWELGGLLQAVTTRTSVVGDRRIPFEPHPLAGEVLREVALALVDPAERPALRAVLRGQRDPATLPAGAAAIHALLRNRVPERTPRLIELLPGRARRLLERLSPAAAAPGLRAPVVAMHSTDDAAVPHAELLRLQHALPEARTLTVSLFRHVEFEGGDVPGALRDLWRGATFVAWLLEAP
ncbi:MAG TPA: hypothetical protein VM638_06720 [Actinomycetota bacterium]|nr:hypothetical protein [Actinomycetota bacterium]